MSSRIISQTWARPEETAAGVGPGVYVENCGDAACVDKDTDEELKAAVQRRRQYICQTPRAVAFSGRKIEGTTHTCTLSANWNGVS